MHNLKNRITTSLLVLIAGAGALGAGHADAVPLLKYAPEGRWNGDTVLLVHGGGWGAGGHDVYERNGTVAGLTSAGFRVVSMDYADLNMPRAVRQVAGVARALDRRSPRGGRLVVWGDSAGGHLALMAASRTRSVAAVVAVSAPSDLRGFRAGGYVTKSHVAGVLRGAGAWRLSPLWAVRSGRLRVPVLLVAQRGDPVVKWSRHTVPLYRALRAKRVPVRLVPVVGAAHTYMPEAVGPVVRWLK